MFPLGTVLLPQMLLPLHVFEPRYRELTTDVLAGDRRFGVVLIERGPEVGGGDIRTGVGTVAEVVRAEQLDEDRWLVVAVGTRRFRVVEWLPDDPYPRARVEDWPDPFVPVPSGTVDRVRSRLERVLRLVRELGGDVPEVTLSDDPGVASYQAALLGSIGPLDAQRLLTFPDAAKRLDHVSDLLADQEDLLRFRLRDA
jgi:Lon protease-like protein